MDFRSVLLRSISLAALSVGSAFAVGYPATSEDLRGMVSMSCSGALIRVNRRDDQAALLLTNGHCATNASIDADDALVNVPYQRGEITLYAGTDSGEPVAPARVLYATRTRTDLALIELKSTYGELIKKGAKVYEVADDDAKPGTDIQLVSGFSKEKNLCAISHVVPKLVEDVWTTTSAYAMKDPCPIAGGWSGTPMIDPTTLKIVGILNSTNVGGALCTLDNPCEVDDQGNRLAFAGRTYGQRTSMLIECFTEDGMLDLSRPRCGLVKPKPRPSPSPSPAPGPSTGSTRKKGSVWPKARTRK